MTDTPAERRLAAEIAAFRLTRALRVHVEPKAHFDPAQARVPKGSGRESGRWSGVASALGTAASGLRTAVQTRMKRMIDDVASWTPGKGTRYEWPEGVAPTDRRLHVLFPAGRPFPGQAGQIAAARAYARSKGVTMKIRYGR